jgi:hypothetical protein
VEQPEDAHGRARVARRLLAQQRRGRLGQAVDGDGLEGCFFGQGRLRGPVLERAIRHDHATHRVLAREAQDIRRTYDDFLQNP